MNSKKVKALRKQMKYHPNDGNERTYEKVNRNGSLELTASCKRYQYQQAKKEMHGQ